MKYILYVVIVILLVLLGVLVFGRSNQQMVKTEENNQAQKNMGTEEIKIEDGTYVINTDRSIINWTGKKKILTNWIDTGTINIQSGILNISGGAVKMNELLIDINSIETSTTGSGSGQSNLTTHLKSADFFDAENYPTANFVAKDFALKGKSIEVTGDLTIKDRTNEIKVLASASKQGSVFLLKGSTDLDRTLWNIRFGSDKFFDNLGNNVIDDIINIQFEITVEKQ